MPSPTSPDSGPASSSSSVALSDILGTHRSITSFCSFIRAYATPDTNARLAGSSPGGADAGSINTAAATTVLAPLNSAVDALPRKPWEDPREIDALGDAAYDGSPDAQKRADANLRRFVEAHLVPESPWPEGRRAQNMAGRELWWEARPGGERVIMPDGVEVDRVASRVANGEVWFLNGVLGQTPPKSS